MKYRRNKMKRHFNRLLASVMIGVSVVSLTACSASEGKTEIVGEVNQKVPMGRYMEENLELPSEIDRIIDYTKESNGTLTLYGYNKERKLIAYTQEQGKTWQEKNIEALKQLENEKNMIWKVIVGQDDKTYVLYANQEMAYKVGKLAADGTLEEVPIDLTPEGGSPVKIEVLENGDILIGSYGIGITKYSGVDGAKQKEYVGTDGEFVVIGEQLALLDMQRGGVVLYNIASGEEENLIAYDGLDWGSKLISDQEGNLYIINSAGINRLANGGSTWENIIEPGMSSFGKPSLHILGANVDGGEFNVLFSERMEGYEMVKYTYNPDIPSRPTTEVSIYMLEDNMTLRQAAAEYQRQNPEVMIRLQVGIKSGETTTKADAIRTLNTELLAGKGPDILMLDGLPIDSYRDKGVLLNVSELVGPMIDDQQLLGNIMEAFREEGNIYAVPTSFELPILWGDADLLKEAKGVEELAKWAEAYPDQQVMYNMSPAVLMKAFYGVSATNWLDEQGQIKQAEFIQFLEAIQTLADEEAGEIIDDMAMYELIGSSREYMAYSDTQVHLENLMGFVYLSGNYPATHQRGDGDFEVMQSNGKGVYTPQGIIGINANSKNIEIAQGILKTALSESVQKVDLGEGFPVNTVAFDAQNDSAANASIMAVPMTRPGSRPIEFATPSAEVYKKVADQGKWVSEPTYEDEVLLEMMIEETKGYFDGTKTAQEAAQAVAQRTKAYLSE